MTVNMTIVWLIIFLFLILVEIMTVGLVSIWFAFGSIAALITSYFTDSLLIQVIIFLLVSVITLVGMKPFMKKFKLTKIEPTNLDRVIGKRGEVIKKITEDKIGEVKVLGAVWSAISKDELEVGDRVIIEKIDGVKLVVRKEKN